MRVIFCDTNQQVAAALMAVFLHHPHVEIRCGNILDVDADEWVSPANSFGWMDGGIDDAYRKAWPGIEELVKAEIRSQLPFGELLVGQATRVHLPHAFTKPGPRGPQSLIVAPTMRKPGVILDSVDVMLAARAAFDAAFMAARQRKDYVVACPGMGTLTGRVASELAARRMREGYDAAAALYPDLPLKGRE